MIQHVIVVSRVTPARNERKILIIRKFQYLYGTYQRFWFHTRCLSYNRNHMYATYGMYIKLTASQQPYQVLVCIKKAPRNLQHVCYFSESNALVCEENLSVAYHDYWRRRVHHSFPILATTNRWTQGQVKFRNKQEASTLVPGTINR